MLLMPILGEKTDARKVVRPILIEGRERHILGIRFPAGSLPEENRMFDYWKNSHIQDDRNSSIIYWLDQFGVGKRGLYLGITRKWVLRFLPQSLGKKFESLRCQKRKATAFNA